MYYFCNKYFAFDFKKINISTDHKKYAIILYALLLLVHINEAHR